MMTGNARRILLLATSRFRRLLIQRKLESFDSSVIVAAFHFGSPAIAELRRAVYDALVLDNGQKPEETRKTLSEIHSIAPDMPVLHISDLSAEQLIGDLQLGQIAVLQNSDTVFNRIPGELNKLYDASSSKPDGSYGQSGIELQTRELRKTLAALEHEVNNPLMTILGATELLIGSEGIADEELSRKIKIIRRSAQRIKNVLLSYSEQFPPMEVDLSAILSTGSKDTQTRT